MSLYIPRKFFRTMQNEDLQNGKIRVPKEFVELHWKSVSNPVVFILPNGATQEIYWKKHNGDIWFQKNWEKFAKFLKFRYIVNFEYIGGSYFKIEIFGVNSLEIDYSNIKFIDEVVNDDINGAQLRKEAIEVSDDDGDKSLDESELPTQTHSTKNGKRKRNMDFNAKQQNISCSNRVGMNKKAKKCNANYERGRKRGGMIKERTRKYCSLGENPSFELQLSPSYVHGRCLRIPNDFSREYLKGFKGTVKIRFGMDKPKNVKLIIDTHGSSIITHGWKPFAEKYKLKAGDKCKFELTESQPFLFTITINGAINKPCYKERSSSRDNNIVVTKCNTEGTSGNRRVISDPKGHNVMKHNTFELIVTNTYYPYVPNEFLRRYKKCCGKFVKLKVDGKSWFVKVKYYPRGSRLSLGWTKFKKECKLKVGDICHFKVIDEEKFMFEVSFVRK